MTNSQVTQSDWPVWSNPVLKTLLLTGVEERSEISNWLRRRYWIWYMVRDRLRDESLIEEFFSVCLCVWISLSMSSFSGLSSTCETQSICWRPVEQPYLKPLIGVFLVSLFPIMIILPTFKLIFPLLETLDWWYCHIYLN